MDELRIRAREVAGKFRMDVMEYRANRLVRQRGVEAMSIEDAAAALGRATGVKVSPEVARGMLDG